jgi:ADP-ribose pyrophosphatase YjhB (NUDIX family)
MAHEPIRHVARVVVLDQAKNVLLVKYKDSAPMDPFEEGPIEYWVPPGGALKHGENHHTAALRELREETGLRVELGPWLWEGRHNLRFRGEVISQWERFYLAMIKMQTPEVANQSSEAIRELRWWSLTELHVSSERFFPEGFVTLVEPIFTGHLPAKPLRTG